MRALGRLVPTSWRPGVARLEATVRNVAVRRIAGRGVVDTALPWRAYGAPNAHVFFGYHDITPFDEAGAHLLAHRVAIGADPARDPVDLVVLDRETGEMRTLGRSDLWSWQMGARLRWLPGGRIAWNALAEPGVYGATIVEAQSGRELARLATPLYDVAPSGETGLSLDFARLQRLRPGYGYARAPDETAADPCPARAGIDRVRLSDGARERIVALPEIAALDPHPTMRGATHYLNHLSFAPDGRRFCLLHLWLAADGRRRVRLVVLDLDGTVLFHVPGQEHVSHFDWTPDGSALLVFGRLPGDDRPRYQIVDIASGRRTPVPGAPAEDGHPMFKPGDMRTGSDLPAFVCDTYPDRSSYRALFLCESGRAPQRLARFSSPPRLGGERRCDLHPRWSPDGAAIAVDSAHDGRRALVVVACPAGEGGS
ncbi:hypothetical protein [Salinarimonas sp.]|uniref:hypothetical protein n=1 Tax=Salinarimonas sp. TaxID=2766526 RepID=UPI0032D8EC72